MSVYMKNNKFSIVNNVKIIRKDKKLSSYRVINIEKCGATKWIQSRS